MTDTDIAWAAGFFEGEGHVKAVVRGRSKSYISIDVSQVYREPLDKLQELFGGKVYGPYGPYATNKQAYFLYTAYNTKAVNALTLMMPYLFRKGVQAQEVLQKWKEHNENTQ